ncbi:aldehyde dehydrogenase family protein [Methyloceanibacter sp.]|uniref:aldehyde dehydrogenase family protein n=1 Tax=Methyloceanibacter sp. TaxID=1965321 RepID=UPI00356AA132
MSDLMLETSRDPTGSLAVTSPFDGRGLAQLAAGGPEHVKDALAVAHMLFRDKSAWLSVPQRLSILNKAAEIMRSQVEELTLLAASEGGKPYRDSRVEVIRAIDGVHLCAEALRGHPGHVIPIGTTPASAGRTAFTRKEPIGVVAVVSAFNHPLNLIVHQVGPAVASGCPVVVKPAADTPLSCVRFVEILREAGLPNAWCQVLITEDLNAVEALVTDRRVGFFSFIGSARVGWMLRTKLAPGARCALEHGGAAPVIIAPPYDRDAALAAVLKGGFYHAGQVCVSVQRVFVPRAEAAAFAEDLAAEAKKLVLGSPEDENTDVGPLIRPSEVLRVSDWVDEAIAAGAVCLCGGKTLANNCYSPTVLLDPPADVKVSTLEIFGPIVCVYGYDDLDAAVAQANALPVAFQSAVFTSDIDMAMQLFSSLDGSALMINDHSAFRDDVMPFAGLRESGLGVGGIPYTMEDMQIEKMMVVKSAR